MLLLCMGWRLSDGPDNAARWHGGRGKEAFIGHWVDSDRKQGYMGVISWLRFTRSGPSFARRRGTKWFAGAAVAAASLLVVAMPGIALATSTAAYGRWHVIGRYTLGAKGRCPCPNSAGVVSTPLVDVPGEVSITVSSPEGHVKALSLDYYFVCEAPHTALDNYLDSHLFNHVPLPVTYYASLPMAVRVATQGVLHVKVWAACRLTLEYVADRQIQLTSTGDEVTTLVPVSVVITARTARP